MASFSVVSNISAVNAQANLTTTNIGLQKSLERLSTGYRINRSGDDAAGKIAGFSMRPPPAAYVPPSYVDPSKFTEEEVSFGTAPWILPGTLAMPVGAGPFPAVILVHGSGPNDRDETLGPNKPFKDIALGLASRGIAVLRYEKRTRQFAAAATTIRTRPSGSIRRVFASRSPRFCASPRQTPIATMPARLVPTRPRAPEIANRCRPIQLLPTSC